MAAKPPKTPAKRPGKPAKRPRKPKTAPDTPVVVELVPDPVPDPVAQLVKPLLNLVHSDPLADELGLKRRRFSLLGLAKHIGIDRSTLENWVTKHGCPVVREGAGKGTGNEWEFDVADVWKWHAAWQREKMMDGVASNADTSEADTKLLKLATMASVVVPVAVVVEMQARVNAEFRQALMAIAGRITRTLNGFPPDRVASLQQQIDFLHAEALTSLSKTMATVVPKPSKFVHVERGDVPDRPH